MKPTTTQMQTPSMTHAAQRFADFNNSYARLPADFFVPQAPTAVPEPRLLALNRPLAHELGLSLEGHSTEQLAAWFSGNVVPDGAEPLALAYAGHQFGNFVPRLGDGRAILLGEVRDQSGVQRDIVLKGAGRTAWSRGGDGRSALGPVLREYLVSEAMHAMGIPSTRALAIVASGQGVLRETVLPGAVLTRVAASHVRVGTFQYFAARGEHAALRRLADYVIDRHYPAARESAEPYLALLAAVSTRQAQLIARWMQVGFIHGVMNTDNTAISGETLDYGPCAFMETYDPAAVFSSIDSRSRYAYARQGDVAQWNVARLAECLLPLLDGPPEDAVERATGVVANFSTEFAQFWLAGMLRKLGIECPETDDLSLVQGLLDAMQDNALDFTQTFRRLADCEVDEPAAAALRAEFTDRPACDAWMARWRSRLARETSTPRARQMLMHASNPLYLPRNHLIEEVIQAAVTRADFGPFEALLPVITRPFSAQAGAERYAQPASPDERVEQTFCGT